MNDEEELEILIPVSQKKITNADLLMGKTIEPIKRLQVISEDDSITITLLLPAIFG